MNSTLIIAEKPSVALAIAAVVGADKRKNGYLEGNGYLVSWCVGHLVSLAQPENYDLRLARWRRADLPIRGSTFPMKRRKSSLICFAA